MATKNRILEATADLLARSAEGDVSTRAVCDAAGITAPVLYHHFGDKEGLLTAVVDFGWEQFLAGKRDIAASPHHHVAEDLRTGWDNHVEFALANPNFYRLLWSPGVTSTSVSIREAYRLLREALNRGAARGQLRVPPEVATPMIMSAVVGACLSLIFHPELFDDEGFATTMRDTVIAAVVVPESAAPDDPGKATLVGERTLSSLAAELSTRVESEPPSLTEAELALLKQWLAKLTQQAPSIPHEVIQ